VSPARAPAPELVPRTVPDCLTSATALQSLPMLSSSPRTVRALRFEEVANLECGGRA